MEKSLEQRKAIKFCVKLGKASVHTYWMTQGTFGDDSKSISQSDMWQKMFRERRENVTEAARSGCPVTSRGDADVVLVRELSNADRRMNVCAVVR